MAIQYSTTHRTNAMTQLNTDIGANAQIIIYSGSAPANVGTAPTGTLLVQFAGNAGGFGTASAAVLTASAVANATAAATGAAGYFRINTSGGTAVLQGTCGTTGTDMILTNTSINSGQTCTFSSMTVTAFGV
jgi:hypothetical protein